MKILHYLESTMYQQNEHLALLENILWILERWLLCLPALSYLETGHPVLIVIFISGLGSIKRFHYAHER